MLPGIFGINLTLHFKKYFSFYSCFILLPFFFFLSTFFLKVFVLWKCQLYSNEAQALFAHKGAGTFHCFMVYYEAQCESVGGTIWCLPLGVVTAIILPLDWQKKKIQHARYSVNMDSMKKILTRNKMREPGMCDNLLELIPWSI